MRICNSILYSNFNIQTKFEALSKKSKNPAKNGLELGKDQIMILYQTITYRPTVRCLHPKLICMI